MSLCGFCHVKHSFAIILTPTLLQCTGVFWGVSEYSPEIKCIERDWKRAYNVTLGPVRIFTLSFVHLDIAVLILTVVRPVLKIIHVATLCTHLATSAYVPTFAEWECLFYCIRVKIPNRNFHQNPSSTDPLNP